MKYVGMIVDELAYEVGIAWTTGCDERFGIVYPRDVKPDVGFTFFLPQGMEVKNV